MALKKIPPDLTAVAKKIVKSSSYPEVLEILRFTYYFGLSDALMDTYKRQPRRKIKARMNRILREGGA